MTVSPSVAEDLSALTELTRRTSADTTVTMPPLRETDLPVPSLTNAVTDQLPASVGVNVKVFAAV